MCCHCGFHQSVLPESFSWLEQHCCTGAWDLTPRLGQAMKMRTWCNFRYTSLPLSMLLNKRYFFFCCRALKIHYFVENLFRVLGLQEMLLSEGLTVVRLELVLQMQRCWHLYISRKLVAGNPHGYKLRGNRILLISGSSRYIQGTRHFVCLLQKDMTFPVFWLRLVTYWHTL